MVDNHKEEILKKEGMTDSEIAEMSNDEFISFLKRKFPPFDVDTTDSNFRKIKRFLS
jgi:hypothetical protein